MGSFAPFEGSQPTVLTVPGLHGSGPAHWQSLWERDRPSVARAELGMWNTPHRNSWVTRLDQSIRQAQAPVVLAAHSLGCIAVAWWAALSPQPYGWPVAGALLVAPADVDRADAPSELRGFAPAPHQPLPFPSIVVGSGALAASWGSHFVDAGSAGHLNAASRLGHWPEGQELLDRLIAALDNGRGHSRPPADVRATLAATLPAREPRPH